MEVQLEVRQGFGRWSGPGRSGVRSGVRSGFVSGVLAGVQSWIL